MVVDSMIMGARHAQADAALSPAYGQTPAVSAATSAVADPLQGNVLLLSQRRIADLVAYCMVYEFEDALASLTAAQRIDATDLPALEFSRRAYKLARFASGSPRLARRLAPYPSNKVTLQRDYELFFPMFSHVYELYALASIPNWRQRCHKAACFITEVWSDWLPEYLVEMLSQFDHIFIGGPYGVADISRISGRPCSYLPLAADVLRFAPASVEQPRAIDLCNIGRRSQITHQALVAHAENGQFFYYYDTVAASGSDGKHRTFRVENAREHRQMLATLLKRSRYYIANRSMVNRPEFTAGREEISARFYEGAAAGAVMLGEAPRSDSFKGQFDWQDAVIHLPFDSPDIARFLAELDADPERVQTARRANVRHAALRHDWLHRISTAFDMLGLAPTAAMRARARRLEQIAAQAR
ncbi:MAG TPA: glycosyltransferase [Steroidobacteraceae bacterium]|nr:glycosyltransferase [Steroidobacteraceae bacterium]